MTRSIDDELIDFEATPFRLRKRGENPIMFRKEKRKFSYSKSDSVARFSNTPNSAGSEREFITTGSYRTKGRDMMNIEAFDT